MWPSPVGKLSASLPPLAAAAALILAPLASAASTTPPVSDADFSRVVHAQRACLTTLPAQDRLMLDLRLGINGRPKHTVADVARQLHRTPAQETAQEISVLRRLEAKHRSGTCPGMKPSSSSRSSTPRSTPVKHPVAKTRPVKHSRRRVLRYALVGGGALVAALLVLLLLGWIVRGRWHAARRRRVVGRWVVFLLRPVFKFDFTRGAFVLRGVGGRIGPVLVRRE